MKIHLGHHFFGAGNLGDDFMLGGFLAALVEAGKSAELTCCVPHPTGPLAGRFPEVRWLGYDQPERRRCIESCDIWLGLGGSPWQSAVSPWFTEHLAAERAVCAAAGKPMFFLGVGGQDAAAYAVPALRQAAEQAEMIWTRDDAAAAALAEIVRGGRVRAAADLAHIFFGRNSPPPASAGRLTAALNFDYSGWAGLPGALSALEGLPAGERIWFAQEARPLPGAEQWLYARLELGERAQWRLQLAETGSDSLPAALARWASGQWLFSSRFHATLAGAWAGSRAVVISTNEKLRGAAAECGYPLFALDRDPIDLAELIQSSTPPPRARMQARAALARQACTEFFALIGL